MYKACNLPNVVHEIVHGAKSFNVSYVQLVAVDVELTPEDPELWRRCPAQ